MSMTRAEMLAHIDTKAGAVRSKYITVAPGQEATYIIKGEQARAYSANGFAGSPPSMIASEAAALGQTPRQACERIMLEEAAWVGLAASIESARRTAKVGIVTAPSEAVAQAIFEQAITGFSVYL